jgi:hypothetical protein
MRGSFVLLATFALLAVSGCGYHTLGSAAHLPDTLHTLAVPTFKNKTQSRNLSESVVSEKVATGSGHDRPTLADREKLTWPEKVWV